MTIVKKTRSQKLAEKVFSEMESLENDLIIMTDKYNIYHEKNNRLFDEFKKVKKLNFVLQSEKSDLIDETIKLNAEIDQLKAEQKNKKVTFGKITVLCSIIVFISFLF